MQGELRSKVRNAGSYVAFSHIFTQLIRFGSNLILTRLLMPEMFGLMAIVTIIMTGLAMFSDIGLLQNVIHSKRGGETEYLHTAWTIQILRGGLIFVIVLLISAGFYYFGQLGLFSPETSYGDSELPLILAVISVVAVIDGFTSIHLMLLNRNLDLAKVVTVDVVSQVVGITFMIVLAAIYHSVWALVIGTIVSSMVKMLISHTRWVGPKCRLHWDKTAVTEIIHFGKWIFVSSILGFLLNQGDRLLLGGLISSETLGYYFIAFLLASAAKDILLKLISSVFYPLLSKAVRENELDLKSVYYKLRKKIDAIAMFSAGFLFVTGSLIINFLYDTRYSEAGWMLELLSLSLIWVGWFLASQCFLAIGKPKIEMILITIQVVSFYLTVPLAFYFFGLFGTIVAISIFPVIRAAASMILMKKYLFLDVWKEVVMIPMIFVGASAGMVIKAIVE